MKLSDLKRVNREVNDATTYRSDMSRFGTDEWWDEANGEGDCEDYAIAKLRKLVAAGWSIDDLRLACCYAANGEYHAVLIASADEGDFMLDNCQPDPIPASDIVGLLGYRPDKIQSHGGSREWVKWVA